MKHKLLRLQAIAAETAAIQNELNAAVQEAAWRYAQAKVPDGPQEKGHFIWQVEDDGQIKCDYSEFWGYGGHAEGTFTFPIELVYSPEKMAKFEEQCEAERKKHKQFAVDMQREQDRVQFEALKRKLYGEAENE